MNSHALTQLFEFVKENNGTITFDCIGGNWEVDVTWNPGGEVRPGRKTTKGITAGDDDFDKACREALKLIDEYED